MAPADAGRGSREEREGAKETSAKGVKGLLHLSPVRYVMLFLMAATSNSWSVRALGHWWKRLHSFGIHWLWFIFTFTYFGRLLDPASFDRGIVQFFLCILAFSVRLVAWRKRR